MCLLNGLALGSYGVVAPAAQSLFLDTFDVALLPYAWLAVMVAAAAATVCLKLLTRHISLPACFAAMAFANAALLAYLLFLEAQGSPRASFAVYVWRDVYILVLLELFWMLMNLSPLAQDSHALYGWVSAAGTTGTIVTSLVAGALAERLGTRPLLWAMVPSLGGIGILALAPKLAGAATAARAHATAGDGDLRRGELELGAVAGRRAAAGARWSSPLLAIFAMVAVGHMCLTLLDFQVTAQVQAAIPEADPRTRLMSYLHSATNMMSVVLQVGSGFLLRRLSVSGALMVAPLLLAIGLGLQAMFGGLAPLLGAKLMVKGADHSLYRIGKESLYMPLSFRQKTDGKAMIDIAGSRAAKGLASAFILIMVHQRHQAWVATLSLVMVGLWAATCAVQRWATPAHPTSPSPLKPGAG